MTSEREALAAVRLTYHDVAFHAVWDTLLRVY